MFRAFWMGIPLLFATILTVTSTVWSLKKPWQSILAIRAGALPVHSLLHPDLGIFTSCQRIAWIVWLNKWQKRVHLSYLCNMNYTFMLSTHCKETVLINWSIIYRKAVHCNQVFVPMQTGLCLAQVFIPIFMSPLFPSSTGMRLTDRS